MSTLGTLRIRKAVGAIAEFQGHVLLVRKVKAMDTFGGPRDIEGEWGFPCGGVKNGEDVEMALRRELAEEAGLTSYTSEKELPAFNFDFGAEYRQRSGFERQHTRMFLVRCEQSTDLAPNNPEIDVVKFVTMGEVASMLHYQSSKDYFQELLSNGLLD